MRRSAVLLALLAGSLLASGRYRCASVYRRYQVSHLEAIERPRIGFSGTRQGGALSREGVPQGRSSSARSAIAIFSRSPFPSKRRSGPKNRFAYTLNGHPTELNAGENFTPFSLSATATAHGQVVFAGYGITAPEYNYDDYAGIDARGKIVLLLQHEPQEFESATVSSKAGFIPSTRSCSARR